MVGSSKILTVSYGTYSVTAEGFEDPLDVVKATTQFIRGVVTEDPLFGAEPPQIGSDMVEEYIQNRFAVPPEARLALNAPSASSSALAAALAAGPARPMPDGSPALPDDDTIEAAARAAQDAADEEAPGSSGTPEGYGLEAIVSDVPAMAAPAPRPADPESVAAKLERIRSVVSGQAAPDAAPEPAPSAAGAGTDAALAAMLGALEDDTGDSGDVNADPTEDDLADTLAGLLGDTIPEPVEDPLDALLDEVEAETDPDDVWGLGDEDDGDSGDDLPGSDAEAAAAGADAFDRDDEDEDETPVRPDAASAWDDDEGEDDEDAADDLSAGWDEDDADDNASATSAEDDWDALADAWDNEEEDEAPIATAAAPQPVPSPLRARVVKIKRAIFEKAVASGRIEEVEQDDDEPAALRAEQASSLSPEEEQELARELEAVKAELASDFDDWDDEDEDETAPRAVDPAPAASGWDDDEDENDEDWDEAQPAAHAAATSDWDDDWDDEDGDDDATPLRLEHPVKRAGPSWDTDFDALDARAEAQQRDPDDEDDEEDDDDIHSAVEGARKAVKMASPARALLTEQTIKDFDASRILEQTNEELQEPEGNRRRSAIAHLRAAVAATRADRLLGRRPDTQEQAEPYREDLATVVRPRRPQAGPARAERPVDTPRPAPLKLVAEQRIPGDAPSEPVRPRRVSRADIDAPILRDAKDAGGDGDFAAYADRMGARDLPELLEAAAAYMAFVEGRDQFSRPQLMTTMRQAEVTESSREDRLRSFGQLLRDGKIEKTSGGRFTASDRISFKPRKAG